MTSNISPARKEWNIEPYGTQLRVSNDNLTTLVKDANGCSDEQRLLARLAFDYNIAVEEITLLEKSAADATPLESSPPDDVNAEVTILQINDSDSFIVTINNTDVGELSQLDANGLYCYFPKRQERLTGKHYIEIGKALNEINKLTN